MRILESLADSQEWMAELWGKIDNDNIMIQDLLLLKQEVGQAHVNQHLDPRKRAQYRAKSLFTHSKKGRLRSRKLVGWVHSHGAFGLFLSETDRNQISTYLREVDIFVSIVVNSRYERRKGLIDKLLHRPRRRQLNFKIWIDTCHNNIHDHTAVMPMHLRYDKRTLICAIPQSIQMEMIEEYDHFVVKSQFKDNADLGDFFS